MRPKERREPERRMCSWRAAGSDHRPEHALVKLARTIDWRFSGRAVRSGLRDARASRRCRRG